MRHPWCCSYGACIFLLSLLLMLAGCGSGVSPRTSATPAATVSTDTTQTAQPSPLATTAPTAIATVAPSWQTIETFQGTGVESQMTNTFTVPSLWRLTYSCTYLEQSGVQSNGLLAVEVYGSNGQIVNPYAIQQTCPVGTPITTGIAEQHTAGIVSLAISGTGPWVVHVQVFHG